MDAVTRKSEAINSSSKPEPQPEPPKPEVEPTEWEALLREIDVKLKNTKTHKELLNFMNGGHFKERMAAMQAADPDKYEIAKDMLVRMNTKLKAKG
jgi:hypothetical protein